MKVRKMVSAILSFSLVLILFITLPVFAQNAYAADNLEAKLNVNSQSIVKGKTFNLRVYNLSDGQTVSYKSSASSIASVSSTGCVTANSTGSAVITATIKENGKTISTLQCTITVGPPAISVRITPSSLTITVGQKKTLDRVVFPKNAVEIPQFSSNNEDIVSVSAGGRITGKAVGSTYVFSTLENGLFGFCKVTVVEPETTEEETVVAPEPVATEAPEVVTETPAEPETEIKTETVENTDPVQNVVSGIESFFGSLFGQE